MYVLLEFHILQFIQFYLLFNIIHNTLLYINSGVWLVNLRIHCYIAHINYILLNVRPVIRINNEYVFS